MKIWTLLGALVIQCAAAKSWNNDSYSEESYSVFGWIGYVKRISLVVLMLSGVILYYVPESRPHARRICCVLIDLTANGLKSALSSHESDYEYEKIKIKCNRPRYDPSLLTQKHISQDTRDHENFERFQRNYKKSKTFTNNDGILGGKERKKVNGKLNKEHRQSRHRFRNSIIKDVSVEPCMDVAKPVYFYSDKLEDLQKYLKTNLPATKRATGSNVDNYAFLISGSPQQMAMLEQKYEKDNVVLLPEPYLGMDYKECSTSMDRLSSKASGSDEGPTRDNNNCATDSAMETYLKEVELSSIQENKVSRYAAGKSAHQSSQFQGGDECCSPNGCSVSSAELCTREGVKNVLKSSRSLVTPKMHKNTNESNENVYEVAYDNYCDSERSVKPSYSSNSRRVDFKKEDIIYTQRKHEKLGYQYEDTRRGYKKKSKHDDPPRGYCYKDVSYFTDRGGEADDETSQIDGAISKGDLDERPERENALYEDNSEESVYCNYDELYSEPILKNRFKPVLLRAVNWIFGGCPEASRKTTVRGEVGKEENQESADEWLL